MKENKKFVNALSTKVFTTAENGFTEEIDKEEVLNGTYIPLDDGEHYISFSNYFKSRKLKSRTGLAVFKELGLIERDDASDHWLPHGEGWNYCVAKPGMTDLIEKHKTNFVRLYNRFENPDDTKYVVRTKISPTVKLPVLPTVRDGVYEYAEAKGLHVKEGDFSEVIGSMLIDLGY